MDFKCGECGEKLKLVEYLVHSHIVVHQKTATLCPVCCLNLSFLSLREVRLQIAAKNCCQDHQARTGPGVGVQNANMIAHIPASHRFTLSKQGKKVKRKLHKEPCKIWFIDTEITLHEDSGSGTS